MVITEANLFKSDPDHCFVIDRYVMIKPLTWENPNLEYALDRVDSWMEWEIIIFQAGSSTSHKYKALYISIFSIDHKSTVAHQILLFHQTQTFNCGLNPILCNQVLTNFNFYDSTSIKSQKQTNFIHKLLYKINLLSI